MVDAIITVIVVVCLAIVIGVVTSIYIGSVHGVRVNVFEEIGDMFVSVLGMLGLRKKISAEPVKVKDEKTSSTPTDFEVSDNPSGITAEVTYSISPYSGVYKWVGFANITFSDGYSPERLREADDDSDRLKAALVLHANAVVSEYKITKGNNFKWTETL